MTATPMRLEDALRFNGYTIDVYEQAAFNVNTPNGVLAVPDMLLSKLTYRLTGEPPLSGALYLDRLPCFAEAYRPVQLSNILDEYRMRRLGYDTPDEFGLAVRRWGNLHLGPNSVINKRYLSALVDLPLDTIQMEFNATSTEASTGTSTATDEATVTDSATVTGSNTSKARAARSDFPQGQLAGNIDYATAADDTADESNGSENRAGNTTSNATNSGNTSGTRDGSEHRTESGRSGRSVMELLAEQREALINADVELREAIGSLFLGVLDRSENERNTPAGIGYGRYPFRW